jgi:activator of 2-hydroxyglutaryl-CoA dehydratase
MITAGIDAGSRAIKMVLYEAGRKEAIDRACCDQGIDQQKRTRDLFDRVLEQNGLKRPDLAMVVATVTDAIAEFLRHNHHHRNYLPRRGVVRHIPQAATIIDIGGQDCKLIRLGDGGKVGISR